MVESVGDDPGQPGESFLSSYTTKGMDALTYFYDFLMPRSLQILRHRISLISECLGTADPTDPGITIPLDYCSIFAHVDHDTTNMHESLTYEYGRLRYTWNILNVIVVGQILFWLNKPNTIRCVFQMPKEHLMKKPHRNTLSRPVQNLPPKLANIMSN